MTGPLPAGIDPGRNVQVPGSTPDRDAKHTLGFQSWYLLEERDLFPEPCSPKSAPDSDFQWEGTF